MLFKLTAMRLLLAACLLFLSTALWAQQKTVKGHVADANNQPVSGASVVAKGTSLGTTTNDEGNFSLSLPSNTATLTISFLGYESRDISITGLSTVSVSLTPSALANLNEVVITGYTGQQRKNITGAVSTIKGAQLASVPSGNVEQQFQGRAAGVVVITSGQPGTTSQV